MVLVVLLFGCAKEYSYEGGTIQGSIPVTDSTSRPDSLANEYFPPCTACNTIDTVSFHWLIDAGGTTSCGSVTNTVVSPERTAMTFFGPSACWPDEGLIITAFFDNEFLNSGQQRFASSKASLVYYDNTGGKDKLASKEPTAISMSIDQYNNQTGAASGRINGSAIDLNGRKVKINGTFVIQF